ncbi:GntR family transcriptional regulator, partial [Clostridioides difficile]
MKVDPLTTQVYDYISKKIQNGEYEANQRITESEICKSIGVSRTPAREALTRLAGENLLEKIPNKGFVVKEFQEKEKLDTYSVIGVLDALAGSSALQNLTESDLVKMEELTEMMAVS